VGHHLRVKKISDLEIDPCVRDARPRDDVIDLLNAISTRCRSRLREMAGKSARHFSAQSAVGLR
jgi:hypothetical protein